MKNCVLILLAVAALLSAEGLKTFQAGTPIVSADVNSNFTLLENSKVDKVNHESTEQATGLLWFGKPIYRTSIQLSGGVPQQEFGIFTIPGIDRVITLNGTFQLSRTGGNTYPFNFVDGNDKAWLRFIPDNNTVEVYSYNYTLYNINVIIEYTKK